MTENLDPVAYNRAAWDREVDRGNEWTRPVGPDVIARARTGDWSVVLIGYEPVPRDWFPADLAGIAVTSGSACTSGSIEPSHVLLALGRNARTAKATIRFSMGCSTTDQDIESAVDELAKIVRRIGTPL